MPKSEPPVFGGSTPHQRAVALAGWLAERGVTRLRLVSARGTRELTARTTDLPAVLVESMPCRLEAPGLGFAFAVTPSDITPAS